MGIVDQDRRPGLRRFPRGDRHARRARQTPRFRLRGPLSPYFISVYYNTIFYDVIFYILGVEEAPCESGGEDGRHRGRVGQDLLPLRRQRPPRRRLPPETPAGTQLLLIILINILLNAI